MSVRTVEVPGKGEVREEAAEGAVVTGWEPPAPGRRNGRVTIQAPQLRNPTGASVDSFDEALVAQVDEAHRSGRPVSYVIHVERKRTVDPAIPIEQVPTGDRVRMLVTLNGQRPVSAANPGHTATQTPTGGSEGLDPLAMHYVGLAWRLVLDAGRLEPVEEAGRLARTIRGMARRVAERSPHEVTLPQAAAAVRLAIDDLPVPWAAEAAGKRAWVDAVEATALDLVGLAATLDA